MRAPRDENRGWRTVTRTPHPLVLSLSKDAHRARPARSKTQDQSVSRVLRQAQDERGCAVSRCVMVPASGTTAPAKRAGIAIQGVALHPLVMKNSLTLALFLLVPGLSGCDHRQRTYDMDCSNPPVTWGTAKDGIDELAPIVTVSIDANGAVKWAGSAASNDQLKAYLIQAEKLYPSPTPILEVSPTAPCQRVEEVRATMMASPICNRWHQACSEGRNPKQWHTVGNQ